MTTPAATRLSRLLAIVAYLDERGGKSTLTELSQRFGLDPEAIEDELWLVACCGLPPYTPDTLIEMNINDDSVEARIPYYFKRPQRLSAAEGLALLTAGRAMLAVPGAERDGPLARALDKLSQTIGASGGLEVDLSQPEHLDEIRRAVDQRVAVRAEYYSPDRDELTERTIEPHLVFAEDGRWYVRGHDSLRDAIRTFRIDRIHSVQATSRTFDPPAEAGPAGAFAGGPDGTPVTLRLPSAAKWVIETYPVESWSERDGAIEVVLAVSSERWLERLLLRVGPEARVIAPEDYREMAASAASRLLARYR